MLASDGWDAGLLNTRGEGFLIEGNAKTRCRGEESMRFSRMWS